MGRVRLLSALAGTLALAALPGPQRAAAANTLGSAPFAVPDAAICETPAGATEASCTETQLRLADRDRARGGLEADWTGVLARWWVRSGEAPAATTAVRLRLRLFDGADPVPGAATPFFALPLGEPGIHEFPARMLIEKGQRLALDVEVLGSGLGVAAAPIALSATRIGDVEEWKPSLGFASRPPTEQLDDTELLLRGAVQFDSDEDGWGDRTQDGCRYDPRRHSDCIPDEVRPRIRISYAPRQDFIARHKVFLRIRTEDFVRASTNGSLGTSDTTWGLLGAHAWVKPGESALLPVYLWSKPLVAARRALANGVDPYVTAIARVVDASGNRRVVERRIKLPER